MPTQAISAYGIQVRMGDGVTLPGLSVTGATNATPIVITASHGLPVGTLQTGTITGVTGNTAANGTWILESLSATTMALRGSTGNGAFTGAGSLIFSDTYTTIAELTNVTDAGLMSTLVDATAHDGNLYGVRIPTFLSGNTARLSVNYIPANPIHGDAIEQALLTRTRHHFLIIFPNTTHAAWQFTAFITGHRMQAPVAGVLTADITLEMDGAPVLG